MLKLAIMICIFYSFPDGSTRCECLPVLTSETATIEVSASDSSLSESANTDNGTSGVNPNLN